MNFEAKLIESMHLLDECVFECTGMITHNWHESSFNDLEIYLFVNNFIIVQSKCNIINVEFRFFFFVRLFVCLSFGHRLCNNVVIKPQKPVLHFSIDPFDLNYYQ